jgi:hypothetical protein
MNMAVFGLHSCAVPYTRLHSTVIQRATTFMIKMCSVVVWVIMLCSLEVTNVLDELTVSSFTSTIKIALSSRMLANRLQNDMVP